MTLWFDVSDLCIWREPQHTGIQRTAFNMLDELLLLRDDVRLFRCTASHRLEAVERSDLPPRAGLRADVSHRQQARRFRAPMRQQIAQLLHRHAGQDAARTLKDCGKSAETLWNVLRRRLDGDIVDGRRCFPLPLDPAQLPPLSRPFFTAGDVCLSMSATWQFRRYGELIARHKAATPIRVVNVLYDLIPILRPQWLSPGYARRLAIWTRQQMANADLILTISQFQRAEIETYLSRSNLPRRAIRTIRLGDNPGPAGRAAVRPRYVPARPFVLCVSTIDARKNHACLHHVWRGLAEKHGPACPQLLLVGMTHGSGVPLLRRIRNDPMVNGLIVHLSDVGDRDLAWYYDNCLFTIYPSQYEGWGLPVGESLAAGRYCIASNAASLTEAGDSWIDYFDPDDFNACFELADRAIARPEYVRQREECLRVGYRAQTWHSSATQVSEIIDELESSAHRSIRQTP
jgi:hypothetical protein